MNGEVTSDLLVAGDLLEPAVFTVTREWNQSYLLAEGDAHIRYSNHLYGVVHPALLLNMSQHMFSPSFELSEGTAAVLTHNEVEWKNVGRVGQTFTVTFNVVSTYCRRGRSYQVVDSMVTDGTDREIMFRKSTYTHMGGSYRGKD